MTMNKMMTKAVIFPKESNSMIHITPKEHDLKDYNFLNKYCELFYSFFNFGYYLCIIPFRFRIVDGKLILNTSTFRRVIVSVSWILSLTFHYFKQRWRILVDSQHSNVLICFNIIHALMHAVTFSLFYYEAFTKQKLYHQMMLVIKDCQLLKNGWRKQNTKMAKYGISIFHMILLIGIPVLGLFVPMENNNWDIRKTFQWSVVAGKRYVLFGEMTGYNVKLSSMNVSGGSSQFCCNDFVQTSLCDILFSLLHYVIGLPYAFLAAFRIISFLHPAITLYAGVQAFMNEIVPWEKSQGIKRNPREHIFQKYAQLKMLKCAINDCWGFAYFWVLVDHILWLATDLNVGINESGFITRVIVAWFFSGVIVLMIASSEVSRKMSVFKAWLSENSSDIFLDPNEYTKFRETLDDNGIWIGITGLYKFDYNFMGQVVVLVVTLFIIALQSERTAS